MLRAIQEQHWSVRTVTPRNRYAAYAATTSALSCPYKFLSFFSFHFMVAPHGGITFVSLPAKCHHVEIRKRRNL